MSIDFFERMIFSNGSDARNFLYFYGLGCYCFQRFFASEAIARVVKLVDTRDLKSLEVHLHAGSTPARAPHILWEHRNSAIQKLNPDWFGAVAIPKSHAIAEYVAVL